MPVVKKLIAQSTEDSQMLGVDSATKFIVNNCPDWQILFGPKSAVKSSDKEVKLHAKFNTDSLNDIQLIAYLYDKKYNGVRKAASAVFQIYKVSVINWTETFILSANGLETPDHYFYSQVSLNSIIGTNLDGDTSLRIDVSIIRGKDTFINRIYVNHLGVYDSIVRLRKDVQFLDLTKLDE